MPGTIPDRMIVEDFDGGYYIVEFKKIEKTPEDGKKIPLYAHKRYYHRLEDALIELESR